MLLSLDADAQPTVDDDSSQCGSASLQQVANMVRVLASNQQAMMDKMEGVKRLIVSRVNTTVIMVEPSKQPLVSALVCEYDVCFCFHYTDLTRRS